MTGCKQCTTCCRYVAVEIDTPRSKSDFRDIIWYVSHQKVKVFVDDEKDWYIEFTSPCEHLDLKGNCKIYSKRPDICREHSSEDCECNGTGSPYKYALYTKEDVEKYVKKHTVIKSLY